MPREPSSTGAISAAGRGGRPDPGPGPNRRFLTMSLRLIPTIFAFLMVACTVPVEVTGIVPPGTNSDRDGYRR